MLDIAAELVRQGHPVLLFDLRGSGRSGGDHYTMGAKEVWDMGGAIDYLNRRGLAANGVDVLGYSMGGATVLLDAPDEPLVRAVAEDSAYAELGDIIDDHCIKCRRMTNHSIVSLVNGEAAKVRCRTCYHDHDYRHEQAPPSKKELKKAEAQAARAAGTRVVEEPQPETKADTND